MDPAEKFLLASIGIMFMLYLSALPFVQYYNGLETLTLNKEERLIPLDLQLTSSFSSLTILVLMLIFYRADVRWNIRARL
jgi:hypothetical protein